MFKGLLLAGALALAAGAAQAASDHEPTPQELRSGFIQITEVECRVHAVGWLKDIKSKMGPIMYENSLAEQAGTCLGSAIPVIDALVDEMFNGGRRLPTAREAFCLEHVKINLNPSVVWAGRMFQCFHSGIAQ